MKPTRKNLFLKEIKEGFSKIPEYVIEQAGDESDFKAQQKVVLDKAPIQSGKYLIAKDEDVAGVE